MWGEGSRGERPEPEPARCAHIVTREQDGTSTGATGGAGEAWFYFSSPSAPLGLDVVIPLDSTSAQSQEQVKRGRDRILGSRTTRKGLGPWSASPQAGPPAAQVPGRSPGVLPSEEFLTPHALGAAPERRGSRGNCVQKYTGLVFSSKNKSAENTWVSTRSSET